MELYLGIFIVYLLAAFLWMRWLIITSPLREQWEGESRLTQGATKFFAPAILLYATIALGWIWCWAKAEDWWDWHLG